MRRAPERKSDDEREAWATGEDGGFRADREADGPPATADRFAITDMQHWIDLCA